MQLCTVSMSFMNKNKTTWLFLGSSWSSTGDDSGYGQCHTKIESTLFVGQVDIVFNRIDTIFASDKS